METGRRALREKAGVEMAQETLTQAKREGWLRQKNTAEEDLFWVGEDRHWEGRLPRAGDTLVRF